MAHTVFFLTMNLNQTKHVLSQLDITKTYLINSRIDVEQIQYVL